MNTVAACLCAHCGNPSLKGQAFCCPGCEVVYGILNQRGLNKYYEIREQGACFKQASPARVSDETYAYLDDPKFRALYASAEVGVERMQFYLDGIHCTACLWLIEKLPELVEGVRAARLDLGSSVATVTIAEGSSFARVARQLDQFGYRPHAVRGNEVDARQRRENRLFLVRLGVAAACSGNIMLMAFALYAGDTGEFEPWFKWLSFGLYLPVALFSAVPFYRSAISSFRTRSLSIDVPVVTGLLLGSIASTANLFTGAEEIYLDSLSSLVFLLLASRYLLRRTQQSALSSAGLLHFLTPSSVRRLNGGIEESVSLDSVSLGDRIVVKAGESIPVDGTVAEGASYVNCALLTGESRPLAVAPGMGVFAGTVNESAPLVIEASALGASTRLGNILRSLQGEASHRAPIVAFTDRFASFFVASVFVLIGLTLALTWGQGVTEMMNRVLAVVLITCPCVLALATPMVMTLSIGKAARSGMLIKNAEALERLSQVDTAYLDKTGTLTEGRFELARWEAEPSGGRTERAVHAIESRSLHPIAQAFVRHFAPAAGTEPPDVTDYRETIGFGVQGIVEGSLYEIARDSSAPAFSGTAVAIYRDGRRLARAEFGDKLRDDSQAAVQALRAEGIEPRIISGDIRSAALNVAASLGIPVDCCISECSPERKRDVLKSSPKALMAGDGANDAVALGAAFVSVAVHGGMEVSLRAADCYISSPGVMPIVRLVRISKETMKVVRRNFAFSLVYNASAIAAAVTGHVSPLFAAILMPSSALLIFASSIYGTRALRATLAAAASPLPGAKEAA